MNNQSAQTALPEIIKQVRVFLAYFWERRGWALSIALVVCLTGWAVVVNLPNNYVVSARVYVDTASILRPLLSGLAVDSNIENELELMQKTLLGRPNLERVARETDQDVKATSDVEFKLLLESIKKKTSLSRLGQDIFSIGYRDTDPQRALDVVQTLLTIFVESNLGQNRKEMDTARRFIEDQIAEYEVQLDTAEQRLAHFKQVNVGLLSGQQGYQNEVQRIEGQFSKMRSELRDAKSRYQTLQAELRNIPQFYAPEDGGQGFGGPPSNTDVEIIELEANLQALLAVYTDEHPDVKAIQRRLKAINEKQEEEIKAAIEAQEMLASEETTRAFGVPNPIYEQLTLRLVDEKANIKTLQDSLAELEERLENMKGLAARVPIVEAELTKLNRDYEVLKSRYEELLRRRESERLSRAREIGSEGVQFRVVEPPTIPVIPEGPKRVVFATMVLLVGLGAGIAPTLLLGLIRNTVDRSEQLRENFGEKVMGVVSEFTPSGRRARAFITGTVFYLGVLGLFSIYAGVVILERQVELGGKGPLELLQQTQLLGGIVAFE